MTIAKHAVLDGSGLVVNVILVDPQTTTWTPPSGRTLLDSPMCASANVGDTWNGTAFVAGPTPVDPLAADKQRLANFMPASGSPVAAAVSAFIADTTKDAAERATMATMRSLIRVLMSLS